MSAIIIYIIIGIAGGIIGGMGMGGGTLLIPLLTLFTSAEQHLAQSVNLIAFIPMSVVALGIHIKNKLVDFKYFWWISVPAVITSAIGAFFVKDVQSKVLKICFGAFLIALGVLQLIFIVVDIVKKYKKIKKNNQNDFSKGTNYVKIYKTIFLGEKYMQNTFKHGIHPDGKKYLSENAEIESFPDPQFVYIPVQQHSGPPSEPVVTIGEKVKAGQLIAKAQGRGCNVFASIAGVVKGIEKRPTATGKCDHIIIENDFSGDRQFFTKLVDPSREEIIERVTEAGIVGMGGAGFPVGAKLKTDNKIKTFIINGAECEPYITCDYRLMVEHPEEIIKGSLYLAKAVNAENVVIAVEDNKPKGIDSLNGVLSSGKYPNVEVRALKTKYPQGDAKKLIYSVTGYKISATRRSNEFGVLVNNIHTAFSVYTAIEGLPSYSRVMTVTGEAINNPKNLIVPNGTLFSDLIDFCGGNNGAVEIISGGPMTGFGVLSDKIATTKTTGCLLLLPRKEAWLDKPGPCINCGRCARACPSLLMPMYIDLYYKNGNLDLAEKYGALHCIECGSCAFVCPAKRPLVASIKQAKAKLKERSKKK